MKGLIHTETHSAFHDEYVGMTMERATIKRKKNLTGLPDCFVATQKIGTIFGSAVEGEIEAIGRTEKEAMERLKVERNKLNDSLWI